MLSWKMGILCYLCIVNIIGFFLMGLDKWKAEKGKWRIPERTLFLTAVVGGSPGCWMGMYTFRHKTKHWYFKVGMPLIFVVQVCFILFLKFKM